MAPLGTVLLARPTKKAVGNDEALLSDERHRSDLVAFESDPFALSPWTKPKRRRASRNSGLHLGLNYEMARSFSEDSKQDSLRDANSREDFPEFAPGPGVLLLTFDPSPPSDTDNGDTMKQSKAESSTISTKSGTDERKTVKGNPSSMESRSAERKIAKGDPSSKENNSSAIIWKGKPPKGRNLDNQHERTRQGLRSPSSALNKRTESEANREDNASELNKSTVKSEQNKEKTNLQESQDVKRPVMRSRSTACNERSFEIIPKRDNLSPDVVSSASYSCNSVSEDSISKKKTKKEMSNEDSKPISTFQAKFMSSTATGYAPIGLTRAPSTIVGPVEQGKFQLKDNKWGNEAQRTSPLVNSLKTSTVTLPSPLNNRTSSLTASGKGTDKGQQEGTSSKNGTTVSSLMPKKLEARDSSNSGKTSTTSDVQSTPVAHTREPSDNTEKTEIETQRKQQPKATHVESVEYPLKMLSDKMVGNHVAREGQSRLLSRMNSGTRKSSTIPVAQSAQVGYARESNSNTVKTETETLSVQPPKATKVELVKQPLKAPKVIAENTFVRQRRNRFVKGMTKNTEKPATASNVQSALVPDIGEPNHGIVKAKPDEQPKPTHLESVKQSLMKASEAIVGSPPLRQERSRLLRGMRSRRDKIPDFLEIPGCAHGSLSIGSATEYSSTTENEENSTAREERQAYRAKEVVEIVVAPLPSSQSLSGRTKLPQRSLLDKEEDRSTLSPRTSSSRVSLRSFGGTLRRMRSTLSIRGKRGKDDISETSVSLATTGALQRRRSWFRRDDATESGMSLATTETTKKKKKWFWLRRRGKGGAKATETGTNTKQPEKIISDRRHSTRTEDSDDKRTMVEDFFEAFTRCPGVYECPTQGHALLCVDDRETKLEDSDETNDKKRTPIHQRVFRRKDTHDSDSDDSEDDYVCY